MPNGVAFRDGALYVAEISRVLRFDGDRGAARRTPPAARRRHRRFPDDAPPRLEVHRASGPTALLYVPVGAPCNVCEPEPDPYASIHRMRPDGGASRSSRAASATPSASTGTRGTQELWFTDNGRDMLGDDVPPDELNRAPQRRACTSGIPYCHGAEHRGPRLRHGAAVLRDFDAAGARARPARRRARHALLHRRRCSRRSTADRIFIAEHGSWNRSDEDRLPRHARARSRTASAARYEPFAEGWLQGDKAWGRPVDVAGDARRRAARLRRQGRRDLPHQLPKPLSEAPFRAGGRGQPAPPRALRRQWVGAVRVHPDSGVADVDLAVPAFFPMLSQAAGAKLDGALGYNFLRKIRVTLDYPESAVRLESVESLR